MKRVGFQVSMTMEELDHVLRRKQKDVAYRYLWELIMAERARVTELENDVVRMKRRLEAL